MKNMGRPGKILVLWVLGALLVFGGCGTKKQPEGENGNSGGDPSDAFVWVPEYLSAPDTGNYYMSLSQMTLAGERIYFMKQAWDEDTMTAAQSIVSVPVAGDSAEQEVVLESAKMDGNEGDEEEQYRTVERFFLEKDGNFLTWETIFHWNEETESSSTEYFLCRYDAAGRRISEKDLTEAVSADDGNSYLQGAAMDAEGRIYLAFDEGRVELVDAEGNYAGKIDLNGTGGWIRNILTGRDGKVYATLFEQSADGFGMSLKELDFAGRKTGQTYKDIPGGYSNDSVARGGGGHDFLINSGDSLYGYDLETQTSEKLFDWLDCDVNGEYVTFMAVLEDGRILAQIRDWSMDTNDLVLLTRKAASEVPAKTNLTLGAFYMDQDIKSAVVKFNRENGSWRIKVKTYLNEDDLSENNYEQTIQDAITRMNSDIVSDNCPDLLLLYQVNVKNLAEKGAFADLGSYLEASGRLSRSDYFENILNAYTYGGTLVAIPKSIELNTMAGRAAELGTKPGWTVSEMAAYMEQHPDAVPYDYATKGSVLEMILTYNQDSYVDWESGSCFFDSENFAGLLEFVNRFPDDYDWNGGDDSTPVKIQKGQILFYQANIYNFDSIQLGEAIFGEKVNYIGYPNDKGESGTYFTADTGIAILSKSAHKDGAWAFLEDYLCAENDRYSIGFSTKKAEFEEAKRKAVEVEYLMDENGELILDEEGNPIEIGTGGGIGWGDWSYEYHRVTEEEVALLMQLLESAKPVSDFDRNIIRIVTEETDAYFKGQKSAQDVAGVIQSRVQLYVNENR